MNTPINSLFLIFFNVDVFSACFVCASCTCRARGRHKRATVHRSWSDYSLELRYSVIAALSALRHVSGAKAYVRSKADILQCKDCMRNEKQQGNPIPEGGAPPLASRLGQPRLCIPTSVTTEQSVTLGFSTRNSGNSSASGWLVSHLCPWI